MFETARNGGMQLVASSKESSLIRNNVQQQRVCCENIDTVARIDWETPLFVNQEQKQVTL